MKGGEQVRIAALALVVLVLGGAAPLGGASWPDPNSLSCATTTLLLPSYTDCAQFYMCSNGQEVPLNCAPGTIFDYELQTCNFPSATECWLRAAEEDPTTAAGGGPLAGVDPNSLQCDPAGQQFLLLPSYTECDQFYMCAHGREVLFHCAAGTIFDFENQGCNFPYATQCWLRTEETEADTEDSTIVTARPTTEEPTTTEEPAGESEEVADGSGEINDGSGDADGSGDINDGSGGDNDGSGDINDGSGGDNDGSGDINDGSGGDNDGSGDINDGSGGDNDGSGDINDGSGGDIEGSAEISDGSGDGHDGSGDINSGDWEIEGSGEEWDEEEGSSMPDSVPLVPVGPVSTPDSIPLVPVGPASTPSSIPLVPVVPASTPAAIPAAVVTPAHAGGETTDELASSRLNCASPGNALRTAPYRGDCQRYWRCNGDALETNFCSDGLYFNPKSLQCDYEANVVCAHDNIDELDGGFLVN